MKNRNFYCILLLVMISMVIVRCNRPPEKPKNLLAELIRINDEDISRTQQQQWTDKNAVHYGAVFDGDSIVSPIGTAQFMQQLMCGYVSPNSKYYHSKEVLGRMELATNGLLALQHDDGTIDLVNSNFHSTPDLGFTIYPISMAYSIMLKNSDLKYGELPVLMKKYMLKAGEALLVGGVHTPNHRWVISGALSWLYKFFPNQAYKVRAEQWLAEKVDIDLDG